MASEAATTLIRRADDVELARLDAGLAALGFLPTRLDDHDGDGDVWGEGRALWESARGGDDRALYWRRLTVVDALLRLRSRDAGAAAAFDYASRGFRLPSAVAADEIVLVTGFDPFRLDTDIRQSNPSGRVALALDGTTIGDVVIVGSVFPVRFDAFDRGIVEQSLSPWMNDARVRAIVTVSMGRDGFDLERFPGRRRSSDAPDNANVHGGWSALHPVAARDGPEFVEFSLPVKRALAAGGPFSVTDNHRVRTREDGWLEAHDLGELRGKTAVDGSGGGYLSNEIAYRVACLRDAQRRDLPVGHVHTPRIVGAPVDRLDAIVAAALDLVRAIVADL